MGIPVVYTDFDGVLNAFPDDKVLRRGGVDHAQWLKDGDPRKALYDPGRAFHLDGNMQARPPVGRYRVHWSRELSDALYGLAQDGRIELDWLTTWQPYCVNVLDPMLGWDPAVVHNTVWYDPVTMEHRLTGKLSTVLSRVRVERKSVDPSPDRVDRRRGMPRRCDEGDRGGGARGAGADGAARHAYRHQPPPVGAYHALHRRLDRFPSGHVR